MNKPAAEALIAKLEAATAETQRSALYDALVFAHKAGWISDGIYDQAMQWRFSEAGSAALTLVPEGWIPFMIVCSVEALAQQHKSVSVSFIRRDVEGLPTGIKANAATPALAICIAALKARLEDT